MYALALALASALLFGASAPASKLLLDPLSPFQLAGLLYLGAALGMAPRVVADRRRAAPMRLDRANAARLAGAVLFGGILGPVLLLFGLRLTLAGSVSLLLNLEMVATALLGALLFREHLGRAGWLGVAGVVGAGALLAGGGGWPGILAALLVGAACLCWGLDNHLTALIDGITPARSTLAKGAVAGATNLAIGLATDPFSAPAAAVLAALAVGSISYGASIALYITSAHELGATRAQAVFASAPFVGAALSLALLGEPLGLVHAVAALLLAVSVALLFWSRHEHPHVHEALEHVHSHATTTAITSTSTRASRRGCATATHTGTSLSPTATRTGPTCITGTATGRDELRRQTPAGSPSARRYQRGWKMPSHTATTAGRYSSPRTNVSPPSSCRRSRAWAKPTALPSRHTPARAPVATTQSP
jgi:drug/metabolite transporter (DMT)-like permease